MRRTFKAVIGNGYGDEGKGLITDYLARSNSLVVRFSGGGQAGHTVVTPEGRRHVFRHVGSGSFRGAATHLSRHFLFDPITLKNEVKALNQLGVFPKITVDPSARVVTPWDILLNQRTEEARGEARHGSCGQGIGETMKRNLYSPVRFVVSDLFSTWAHSQEKMRTVESYVKSQLKERNLRIPEGEEATWWEKIAQQAALSSLSATVQTDIDALSTHTDIIFEGSQGLLLDAEYGVFPHVTFARTGLTNIAELIPRADTELHVFFVARSYTTKHGAGPLEDEYLTRPDFIQKDATNETNAWQGDFRYAPYNNRLLSWARERAISDSRLTGVRAHIVTTHLDEVKQGDFVEDSEIVSFGPTRNDVKISIRSPQKNECTDPFDP
jgi:adenylosuccinate synthase